MFSSWPHCPRPSVSFYGTENHWYPIYGYANFPNFPNPPYNNALSCKNHVQMHSRGLSTFEDLLAQKVKFLQVCHVISCASQTAHSPRQLWLISRRCWFKRQKAPAMVVKKGLSPNMTTTVCETEIATGQAMGTTTRQAIEAILHHLLQWVLSIYSFQFIKLNWNWAEFDPQHHQWVLANSSLPTSFLQTWCTWCMPACKICTTCFKIADMLEDMSMWLLDLCNSVRGHSFQYEYWSIASVFFFLFFDIPIFHIIASTCAWQWNIQSIFQWDVIHRFMTFVQRWTTKTIAHKVGW